MKLIFISSFQPQVNYLQYPQVSFPLKFSIFDIKTLKNSPQTQYQAFPIYQSYPQQYPPQQYSPQQYPPQQYSPQYPPQQSPQVSLPQQFSQSWVTFKVPTFDIYFFASIPCFTIN